MKKLTEIASLIWESSVQISFGQIPKWDEDIFLKKWVYSQENLSYKALSLPGWYWLSCDLSYEELQALEKPTNLPTKGCDFGEVSRNNFNTFGVDYLCRTDGQNLVVYNGHEGDKVLSRIRAHFSLKNQNTGALGIKHYDLSTHGWKVRVFTEDNIHALPHDIQSRVQNLINTRTGRRSIESAWRTYFGWPALSKE